jgi:uncharacterized phiE125 gp8 family phage protein
MAIEAITALTPIGTVTLAESDYTLDAASSPPRLVLREGLTPPQPLNQPGSITIKVNAGFGYDATSVPADIRQAMLVAAAHWFGHRGDEDAGGLPQAAAELLDPFRIRRLR